MSLKVVVADDEPLPRERLSRLLREAGCEVVGEFTEGASLLAWLREGHPAEALFLDIHMPGLTGVELLVESERDIPVVFVTANVQYTLAAFEHGALDYILKPVTSDRLAKSLARVAKRELREPGAREPGAREHGVREPLPRPQVARFPVRAGEGMVFLELRRVSHFELSEEWVWAWTQGERYRTSWTSLAEVEGAFPQEPFCRIQRHVLLRPGTIIGLKPLWGRRVLARVPGNLELEVSRAVTPKLKEMLGL